MKLFFIMRIIPNFHIISDLPYLSRKLVPLILTVYLCRWPQVCLKLWKHAFLHDRLKTFFKLFIKNPESLNLIWKKKLRLKPGLSLRSYFLGFRTSSRVDVTFSALTCVMTCFQSVSSILDTCCEFAKHSVETLTKLFIKTVTYFTSILTPQFFLET